MAKTKYQYHATKPGLEAAGPFTRLVKVGPGEGADQGFPANELARNLETVDMGAISTNMGGPSADAGQWDVTFDNSGTGVNGNDGYTLTTGTTGGNKCIVKHGRRLASGGLGKEFAGAYRVSFGFVTNQSAYLGVWNDQADPVGTAPTNGVFFVLANAGLVGRVRGNSGVAADSASLLTITANAVYDLGVHFYNGGTVAASWGFFVVNGVQTAFTPAQLAQLIAMTGNLYHFYHVQTGAAAARTMTVDFGWPCYDR